MQIYKNVSLAECRRTIYNQFLELKAGNISIDEALATSKMIHQIISTYDTEVRAVDVSIRAINAGITDIPIQGTTIRSLELVKLLED